VSRILVIDDDPGIGRSLQLHLTGAGHEVHTAPTAGDGLDAAATHHPQVVFLDLKLPDRSGLDVLPELLGGKRPPAVVMISGQQDMQATIEAIRLGALDYIRKPLALDDVTLAVEKAARRLIVSQRPGPVSPSVEPVGPREIVGRSRAIVEVLKQVAQFSQSRVTVLVRGESGSGKELVARAIHQAASPEEPFVAVNCSALVPTLLESELFGHEKGAFTGAHERKPGKLELAGVGTVLFDEIGDMSTDLQAKLLRAVQEREFEPVGGTRPVPLKARLVASTHRDLEAMVAAGTFREDLLFRLNVARIDVPPLRERMEDLDLLARHLLARTAAGMGRPVTRITDEAIERLRTHDWPGNVRELENALTRAVATATGDVLAPEDVRIDPRQAPRARAVEVQPLREAEKAHVAAALDATGWNISRTARLLEVSPTTLRKKIADYRLGRPSG